MVLSNLKVLAKFGFCSNCSQKLDECSLAHACKICASARMLRFSLKFPAECNLNVICIKTKTDPGNNASRVGSWEACARYECFWKNASSFC